MSVLLTAESLVPTTMLGVKNRVKGVHSVG